MNGSPRTTFIGIFEFFRNVASSDWTIPRSMFIAFLTLGFIPARRLTSFNVGIVPFQASERNWQIVCVHAVRPSWTSLSLLWPNCCSCRFASARARSRSRIGLSLTAAVHHRPVS